MILAQSFWRKAVVTVVAAVLFVGLLEVTMLDPQRSVLQSVLHDTSATAAPPTPGARLAFTASAYCKGQTTTAGVAVQAGVAAADPDLLPVGSVIQVDGLEPRYNGIYTVLDTGPQVQGRLVDLYMWSCNDALRFGRRPVRLTVLRLGWNPRATAPGFLDRLFRRQAQQPTLPDQSSQPSDPGRRP